MPAWSTLERCLWELSRLTNCLSNNLVLFPLPSVIIVQVFEGQCIRWKPNHMCKLGNFESRPRDVDPKDAGGLSNFALNRPLLITLLQIPPSTLPCAPLDQHRVTQIKSFQVCTGGPVSTWYVAVFEKFLLSITPFNYQSSPWFTWWSYPSASHPYEA
jgi:hypothetical protein